VIECDRCALEWIGVGSRHEPIIASRVLGACGVGARRRRLARSAVLWGACPIGRSGRGLRGDGDLAAVRAVVRRVHGRADRRLADRGGGDRAHGAGRSSLGDPSTRLGASDRVDGPRSPVRRAARAGRARSVHARAHRRGGAGSSRKHARRDARGRGDGRLQMVRALVPPDRTAQCDREPRPTRWARRDRLGHDPGVHLARRRRRGSRPGRALDRDQQGAVSYPARADARDSMPGGVRRLSLDRRPDLHSRDGAGILGGREAPVLGHRRSPGRRAPRAGERSPHTTQRG